MQNVFLRDMELHIIRGGDHWVVDLEPIVPSVRLLGSDGSDGFPGSKIIKAAADLYDNRLGWADGISAHAPIEFWVKLGETLGRAPMDFTSRTDRPDFGVLGAVGETLAQAGLDPVDPLPSSPALCATLDEVRRYAESQGKGRYNPESDRRVALDLIAALAGIVERAATPEPVSEDERLFYERANRQDDLNARQAAMDLALRSGSDERSTTEIAATYYEFLTGQPSGKVYATKADVDCLHERIDNLSAEMQRAVSGA